MSEHQDAFHRDMEKLHVRALWERTGQGNRPVEPTWQWRWAEMQPLIDQAVAAVSMADAERRVLSLANPHYSAGGSGITRNISGGLQILLPGEKARPHRHSMNAIRFVLQGQGARTLVDGKPCPMAERDLVITPAWTWHEHIHEGSERMVWFDSLDSPRGALRFDPKNHNPISDIHMRTVQANPLRHVVTDVLKDVRHPDTGACVL